jgi:GntR family transcriptional regulator
MAHKPVGSKTIPLHSQIERTLAQEIDSGVWQPGGTLPAEPELARRFGVSRMTVRQALGALTERGLLIRQRGRATRIAIEPIVQSLGRFYSFAYEMDRLGRDHSTRVERVGLVRPSPAAREIFGLTGNAPVAQGTLVRFLGAEPVMVETVTFRAPLLAMLERPDLVERPLYDILDEIGVIVTRATERIKPVALSARHARLLDVTPRSPAFLVQRTSYARETPVELRESVVRGDCFCIVADLRRDQMARATA